MIIFLILVIINCSWLQPTDMDREKFIGALAHHFSFVFGLISLQSKVYMNDFEKRVYVEDSLIGLTTSIDDEVL